MGDAISVSDPDAGTNPLEVTLVVIGGTITLSLTTDLNFTIGDGDDDAGMTFTGTLTNINAALEGMMFLLPAGAPGGGFTLEISVNDLGATFDDPDQTDSASVSIFVTAPVLKLRRNGWGYDSGDTLKLGNVIVGDNANVRLYLHNIGDASLAVTTPLELGSQVNCGASVTVPAASYDPGESGSVTVSLAPVAAGAFSVLLTITSDDPVNPVYTLTLSGTALDPQALQVTRGSIMLADGGTDDLGALPLGVYTKFVYTLTNTGDVTLILDGPASILAAGNCKLSIAAGVETTLAPGATKDVTILVKPMTVGIFSASVSVATNDADSPFNLTLEGTGLPATIPGGGNLGSSGNSGGCAASDLYGYSWLALASLAAFLVLRRRTAV